MSTVCKSMGVQARAGKNETRDAEIHVCDVVEKKLANLAYINTKQSKADLMTKCHTSEAHKKVCAMMGLRTSLKQSRQEMQQI